MLFARLPHGQIDELFVFLGPDFSQLRRACIPARERFIGVDMPFEILKWHCVNSALLVEKLYCLEELGRVPLRCSICDGRAKTRQMFRYYRNKMGGHPEGPLYMCCLCAFDESRRFLKGAQNSLFAQGGDACGDRARLLLAILGRMHIPRGGFASECFASSMHCTWEHCFCRECQKRGRR